MISEAKIKENQENFSSDLETARSNGDFDGLYLKYFSKSNGYTTSLVKKLPELTEEELKKLGPVVNEMQKTQKESIERGREQYRLKLESDPSIDLTLPRPAQKSGMLHPTTQVIREMNNFFRYYGYSVAEGPEIETAEYNFRKLNLPKDHPATDLQDTLFVHQNEHNSDEDIMLRTHTSSIEARILSDKNPPIRIVVPGKSYRNETANKSNNSYFYQYQGVLVDKGVTLQNLKAIFSELFKFMLGEDTELRFRYKYYPEVSPGMGVDSRCSFCKGNGCEVCKQRGWQEMGGSGMIHYNTLKMCGIDPEVYTGFAFGLGLDRFVMAKFNINDIRNLYGGRVVYE
jgi:phenylalanyl-tRNA synthetase alpha chain